jgi:transmembrane sensor
MEEKQIKALLTKYAEGKCSPEEEALLESAYLLDNESHAHELSEEEIESDIKAVFDALPRPIKRNTTWSKVAIAACLIVALGTGLLLFENSVEKQKKPAAYSVAIKPGKDAATLTLPSGNLIVLNGSKKGITINAKELAYDDGTKIGSNEEIGDQIINTPKGGQYKVVLPDGTLVILNAASSLKFPSTFKGAVSRNVELRGEGYFEVAKDKKHPFRVTAGGQEVEVLGTHFNISNYPEDTEIRTTLLEGSVKVSSINKSFNKMIKPGQQAAFANGGILVSNVDVDDAVAWKNGYFMFNYETLESVMLKISRWYDIEVKYDDPSIKDIVFFGTISKFENISKVLNMLERTKKVKFQINGRTLTADKRF